MAEQGDTSGGSSHRHHEVYGRTGTAVVLVIALGGPLLVMTGFTFLATVTLLLISSPLLIISSPLLILAALVLVAALAGFGIAGAMAIAGLSAFGWVFQSVEWGGMFRGIDDMGVTEKFIESVEKVKEEEK
ncbi:hypothetical protein Vadar_021783 [Vaccinium darrowii]|uniref:Uncharacterized protein n=1 Tax=Vaccinium darrowii TaxID=229202 RepID=A0ACB7XS98_9ERIC|nr:hypothetical protein Vadar_021783 [Vaccinium darrowii]